jgi:CheY-like chemotaxis protein
MAMKIVILEDNAERQAMMRACLADRFYTFEPKFFDTAAETIDFLRENLRETVAIALDHDLEMKVGSHGRLLDPGTGREVASFLATQEPACPVILHSTNTDAVVGMHEELEEAGWKTKRVVPFEDMTWIERDWFFAMRRAIVGPVRRTKSPAGS